MLFKKDINKIEHLVKKMISMQLQIMYMELRKETDLAKALGTNDNNSKCWFIVKTCWW